MKNNHCQPVTFKYLARDIYEAACRICLEVDTFKPDIVIGLAHSGWMPVMASRYLWEVTRNDNFPCHYSINFGQEKRQYIDFKKVIDPDSRGISHFEINQIQRLISLQKDWICEFKILLSQNYYLPTLPNRVLIVDDCVFSGRTATMAIALARSTIPGAEIRFISPQIKNWRQSFAEMWLIRRKAKQKLSQKFENYDYLKWQALNTLVSSTEDVDPVSLCFKPVSATSQLFTYLQDEKISTNEWLELPSWVNMTIKSIILTLKNSPKYTAQDTEDIYSKHILLTA